MSITEIPTDVWEALPEELKKILIDSKGKKANISYEANSKSGISGSGKIYDKITVEIFDQRRIIRTCYNSKNGIKTYSGFFAGPLAGGGYFFDPENGNLVGGIVS